ncbi:unnamed protein product, partial [Adineta ricciae]
MLHDSSMLVIHLFLVYLCHFSWCLYDRTNIIAGIKIAANDDILVSASNAFSNFAVAIHPFRNVTLNGSIHCNIRYGTIDQFVHSVAVIGNEKNSSTLGIVKFVFTAEKMSTMTPYVCIVSISKSTCKSTLECNDVYTHGFPQEYFLIGIDRSEKYAYGFTSSFVFKLNIQNNEIVLNRTTNDTWPSLHFIPRALDIADSWAMVAGYGYENSIEKDYHDLGCLIDLSELIKLSCILLNTETTYIVPSDVVTFNELYEMSVSIRNQTILVGIHRFESVVVLQKHNMSLSIVNTHTVHFSHSSSFGRGVAWIDNRTFAVLTHTTTLQTCGSRSMIFIYNGELVTSTSALHTFPNNQQILGSRLSNPHFVRMTITPKGNMVVLTDHADILMIPTAPIGYTSVWIDTSALIYRFRYVPMPCIGGTYKNHSGIGPCRICPPRTQNPGISVKQESICVPCSNSFCPLGASADIDSSIAPSYSQAVDYPETDDTTDIEDILLQNVFYIGSEFHCMIISPLLWTLIVGILCSVIGLAMCLLKRDRYHEWRSYRNRAKVIFKHTDIIGEGELWIGGLATFAVVVLVAFSYWFSAAFIQRYPIERISESVLFACNPSLMNAKFSSSLQLLALPKSIDSQAIFNLLNQQKFQLTLELVNTGFMCRNIKAQENFVDSNFIHLSIECTRPTSNATTSVSFQLPTHSSNVQINMSGPHWIGGFRLCIRGDGVVDGS